MCPTWICRQLPCPRYQAGTALLASQSISQLVVMRHGVAYCTDCNAVVDIPAGTPANLLPPETTDYWPQTFPV